MRQESIRIARYAILLLGLLSGFVGANHAQTPTVASSPSLSSGVQYVAPTCSGGAPCTQTNDGLSPGSAKWDTDAGQAINDAYAALPGTGGVIYLLSFGGCSNFSTPIALSTSGKHVSIIGIGVNTTCLNYTPSTGTAFSLATGSAGFGQNDALENFSLETGTEGSTANGLVIGSNNVGAPYTKVDGVSVWGFRYDLVDNSYGVVLTNTNLLSCSSVSDSIAFQTERSGSTAGDDTRIHASAFAGCATLLLVGDVNPLFADGLVLANATSTWVDITNGGLFCNGCHWFNDTGTANWFTTSGNLIISNSQFEDSASTGASESYAVETGGFTIITNSVLYTAGHSVTEFLNVAGGNVFVSNFANTTPAQIPKLTNDYSDPYAQTALFSGGFTTGDILTAQAGPVLYVRDGGGIPAQSLFQAGAAPALQVGGTPALQSRDGFSAGNCKMSGGQCSHFFTNPYTSAPVCTVSSAGQVSLPPSVSASATTITVTDAHAPDGTVMNWTCYPRAN